MPEKGFIYAYLERGRAKRRPFATLRAALDQACSHLEGEDAMAFEISCDGDVKLSGMDLIEILPAWLEWRHGGAPHPADGIEGKH